MRGSKSGLLGFGVVVFRVAVENQLSDIDQGVVTVGPNFCDIIDIEAIFVSISDGHDLNFHRPGWEVSISDSVVEIVGSKVLVFNAHFGSFCGSPVLNSLVGLEVLLNQECFAIFVDKFESVGRVSVHVGVSDGVSTLRHQNSYLMESLRAVRPEVPLHVGVVSVSNGVSLLGVDEVRELDGVLDKEHGSVVTDHIVVTILSIELDGKSSGVTIAIVGTTFSSNSRETQKDWGALSNFVKEFSFSVL